MDKIMSVSQYRRLSKLMDWWIAEALGAPDKTQLIAKIANVEPMLREFEERHS